MMLLRHFLLQLYAHKDVDSSNTNYDISLSKELKN